MKLQANWLMLLAVTPGIIINIISLFLWHVIPFLASHPNLPTTLDIRSCCFESCIYIPEHRLSLEGGFSVLFISFIATELKPSLVSIFGLCLSLRLIQRGVWVLVSTWTCMKDDLEVEHGWVWETWLYKCLRKEKMISHDDAWRYWVELNSWSEQLKILREV